MTEAEGKIENEDFLKYKLLLWVQDFLPRTNSKLNFLLHTFNFLKSFSHLNE